MRIRLAQNEDFEDITLLRKQTILNVNSKDYPKEIIHDWSEHINEKDFIEGADKYKRWVAVVNDEIIGFCEHNFGCEITRIYVSKDHLRKGVGSKLLKMTENSLQKQGCKEIRIESTVTAKDFYVNRGYKLVKKDFHKGDKNAPVYKMTKKLN